MVLRSFNVMLKDPSPSIAIMVLSGLAMAAPIAYGRQVPITPKLPEEMKAFGYVWLIH